MLSFIYQYHVCYYDINLQYHNHVITNHEGEFEDVPRCHLLDLLVQLTLVLTSRHFSLSRGLLQYTLLYYSSTCFIYLIHFFHAIFGLGVLSSETTLFYHHNVVVNAISQPLWLTQWLTQYINNKNSLMVVRWSKFAW